MRQPPMCPGRNSMLPSLASVAPPRVPSMHAACHCMFLHVLASCMCLHAAPSVHGVSLLDAQLLTMHAHLQLSIMLPAGLSVWYDTTQVDHGMALNDDYSEQIKEQITTVTLYFTESIGSTPGAFTSMMFQTKSGKQYQFGSYNGKAKTATFNAPYNGFLAALAGTSTTDRLVTLQIIWGKTQAPASGESCAFCSSSSVCSSLLAACFRALLGCSRAQMQLNSPNHAHKSRRVHACNARM